MPAETLATIEPLAVDAREAARLCGVGRTFWLVMHNAGRCPLPFRLGRRCLWRVDELRRWLNAGCPTREAWQIQEKGGKQR